MAVESISLTDFFSTHRKVLIAYSGGIDSTYLIHAAMTCGAEVRAIYVKTAFQPAFELRDALAFCEDRDIALKILECDIFRHEEVIANPTDRCYYCKRAIFGAICREAREGEAVLDGTNADDDEGDRPGMRALRELGVLSPLRICGMTKAMIREAAKDAGIAIWDKPSYACLATRTAPGVRIVRSDLEATERAEGFLMQMGFSDIRIRRVGNMAKVQIRAVDFPRFIENRRVIVKLLRQYYDSVMLDLEARDE